MKPIKLEIEGFFSYVMRQEIDFQRLWEAGFFGLIGETGAGKSALIEAILIALYADSARSGQSPKNLVNPLSENKLSFIQLTFEHMGKVYTARYEVKKGRTFHILNLPTGERKRGNEVPTYITKLLGLSYDDFTLAFVLQQGQFDAFLAKKPQERSAALQSILRLPLNGLRDQTSYLFKTTEAELNPLESQIKQLEEQLRENNPEELKEKYTQIQAELKEIETQIQAVEAILREQETYKSYAEQLWDLQKKYQAMEKQKPIYEERREKISKIENVKLSDLGRLYAQEKGLQQHIKRLKAQIEQHEVDIRRYQERVAELQPRLEQIRPDYERRDYLRRRKDALQKVPHYRRSEKELEELQARIQRGEKLIAEKREAIEKLESQIKEREEKRKLIQEALQRLPTELIQWYAAYESMLKALKRADQLLKAKEEAFQRARKEVENELRSILHKVDILQSIPEDLEEWKDFLRQIVQKLREKMERLKYEQLAATLAASLEPHQACPVCGSTEHPKKAHPDPFHEKRIKELEESLRILESLRESLLTDLIKKASEYQEARKIFEAAQEDSERHKKSFKPEWGTWGHRPDTSPAQISAERQKLEKEKQEIEEEIDKMRREIDKNRKDLEKYEERLEKIKDEYHQKAQEVNTTRELLREVLTEMEIQFSEDDAAKELQLLDKRLKEIDSFEEWERELQEAQTRIAFIQEEWQKKVSELAAEKQNLSNLREEEAFAAEKLGLVLEEALAYLEYPEDQLRKGREEIEHFFAEIKSIQDKIEELRQKAEKFDERLYAEKKTEKSILDTKKSEYLRRQGELQSRLNQAEKDKKNLERLTEQAKSLKTRLEGLKVMKELFWADGFTQYVLSKVLQRLVVRANEYLSRWTRGELELVAGEGKLDLMVRDHLADGHLRGIGTLSGGQRFQAALALALTLSDLVQYRSGTTEHLSGLIIDEGFGTLDTETLHTVVQTLRDIALHGRPIGIITHRTEIQSILPAYVRIERKGRGSVISYS